MNTASRVEVSRVNLCFETCRRNRQLKGSRRLIGKGVLSVVIRKNVYRGLAITGKPHLRANRDAATTLDSDCSGNAAFRFGAILLRGIRCG